MGKKIAREKIVRKGIPNGVQLMNFRISTTVFDKLECYCKEMGCTKSGLIRKLIRKELLGYTPEFH